MVRSPTISSPFRLPLGPVFVNCVPSVPCTCPDPLGAMNCPPSARATSQSPLATAAVSPFLATITSHLQLTENTATLSPAFATLTDRVRNNSFVCHSYKKHPGWGSHRSSQIFFFRNLTTRLSPLSAMSFVIRTYGKSASNSCRIRTSKTQDLKPFRMNTSEKTPRGVPPSSQNLSVFAVRFVVNAPNFELPFSNFVLRSTWNKSPARASSQVRGDVHA
jgi:hypothetical protein